MKRVSKLFMMALLSGFCYFGYCQDVKVNINNQEQTGRDDCPFRINGICITEDIGGVDVEFKDSKMIITNYNNFPVTVSWQISYTYMRSCPSLNGTTRTGNVVLGVKAQKMIPTDRDCNDAGWVVDGIIARKIAQ